MQGLWFFTKDRYLCNEYMRNKFFYNEVYDNPDMNPQCIRTDGAHLTFNASSSTDPGTLCIKKKTKRSWPAFELNFDNSDKCLTINEGPSVGNGQNKVKVTNKCNSDQAEKFRMSQKKEPADGSVYEVEREDTQFKSQCASGCR